MHGNVPLGEKMAYSQGRIDGGMNNGWKDGGENHQCNLCLTKLKSGPGERPPMLRGRVATSLSPMLRLRRENGAGRPLNQDFRFPSGVLSGLCQLFETKRVLFGLPPFGCSGVQSRPRVYLSNALRGPSRTRDV